MRIWARIRRRNRGKDNAQKCSGEKMAFKYKHKPTDTAELDITSFMNLMILAYNLSQLFYSTI